MNEKILINPKAKIKEAMEALGKASERILIIVDDKKKLLGTLTDGDIRRGILAGNDLNGTIESMYNPDPILLQQDQFDNKVVKEILLKNRIELIPILKENTLIDYITWEDVFGIDLLKSNNKKKSLSLPVVIMAGGKGARLEPFTTVLPKPLVPIHEKPVIVHIIERFTAVGVNDFYLSVNYKSRILKAFFEEMQPEYSVNFMEEQEPLGTAGSLRFLAGKFTSPFLVTNCDVIIDADYVDLYAFHLENGYDVTLVASMKNYIIPYGVCELNDDGHLDHINEKPEYNFLVNTGLYVFNHEVLKLIPSNGIYHITSLIADAKHQGMKVGVYPIGEDAWIDVGQWAEYKKVIKSFEL